MSMTGNPCDTFNCEEYSAAQLLGAIWNWLLYGVLVVQLYVYSYNFPRDNRYIKLMVYGIFVLESVQTALCGAGLYYGFAADFGNIEHLLSPFSSSSDVPIMGSMISLTVQCFFAYRILVLSGKQSWWLCAIICLLSVVGAFGAFAVGISSYLWDGSMGSMGGLSQKGLIMIWIIANMLSDLLITSAMLYHLRIIRARVGKLSSHVLVSIVRLTIETNLVTTIVNIVTLLMVCVYPESGWLTFPSYVLGKLYSNTLLVSLNNRIAIHDTYEARGAIVDTHVATDLRFAVRPESTTDTIVLEHERPQKDLVKQLSLSPEAQAEGRVSAPATIDLV